MQTTREIIISSLLGVISHIFVGRTWEVRTDARHNARRQRLAIALSKTSFQKIACLTVEALACNVVWHHEFDFLRVHKTHQFSLDIRKLARRVATSPARVLDHVHFGLFLLFFFRDFNCFFFVHLLKTVNEKVVQEVG